VKFNISRLKLDARCPQKREFAYDLPVFPGEPPGFVRRDEISAPMVFGTAYHMGRELRNKGEEFEISLETPRLYLESQAEVALAAGNSAAASRILHGTGGPTRACATCKGARGRKCVVCLGTGLLKNGGAHKVCAGTGWLVCGGCAGTGEFTPVTTEGVLYLDKALRIAEATPQKWEKIVAVEKELILDLNNGHSVVGRLDLLVEWNRGLWVLDYKTLYRGGDPILEAKGYELDWSMNTYALLAQEYTGQEVRGAWMDFLVKNTEPTQQLVPVPASQGFMVETREWLCKKTSELAREIYRTQRWGYKAGRTEKRTISCKSFKGICVYHPICKGEMTLDPETLEVMGFGPRKEDYVDREDE
jgi:hypothetical protein